MTHLLETPEPISVGSDALGTPVSFRWENKTHAVKAVLDRWRVHKDWWKPESVWYEYFLVRTETEMVVVIYRDFVSGKWYIEQQYD